MAVLWTRRQLDAPPTRVWEILAAFDRLAHWAPAIDHTSYLTTQRDGVGTARRVQVKRTTLVETVTEWEPGSALAYDIEGLPPFVPPVSNRWTLRAADTGTEVTLATTVSDADRGPARLIQRIVSRPLRRSAELLVDALQAAAERPPG